MIVFAFQPRGLLQFSLPKFVVLAIFAPAVALFSLGLFVTESRRRIDTLMMSLVALYFCWSLLAPLFRAENVTLHLFGGLKNALLLLLFIAVSIWRTQAISERMVAALLAWPSLIVALFAILQRSGIDPLELFWGLSSTRPGRWKMLATLGNPTWTAELILLSLPLILVASYGRKFILFPAMAISSAAIVLTGSRGAILGLVFLAFLSLRNALSMRGQWRKILVVGVLVLTLGSLALLRASSSGRLSKIGDVAQSTLRILRLRPGRSCRADGMRKPEVISARALRARLGLWKAGLHQVEKDPLFGAGLLHTRLFLPGALEEIVEEKQAGENIFFPGTLVDRLDEDYLQIAAEIGLPGLLILLLITFRSVGRCRRKGFALPPAVPETGRELDTAIGLSLPLYGFLCLFSSPLHTPATAALFWIFMGLAAAAPPPVQVSPLETETHPTRRVISATVFGFFLVLLLMKFVGLPMVRLNAQAGKAHSLLAAGRGREALELTRVVTDTAPWIGSALVDRARALLASGEPEQALVALEDAEEWISSEWILIYRARALFQIGLVDEARRTIEKGLKILPTSRILRKEALVLSITTPVTGNGAVSHG